MEILPKNIECKLENLPIVNFNETEEFQKIIFSTEFSDIFDYYKEKYLPDVLKTKPELYQRISLYLTITNQDSQLLEDTDQVLYRRPIPTIEEFLTDKFYMGYNNATLYNYWKEQLEEIFKANSPVRKVIFGGCIGCLTKDTVVATLNGNKTIEELLNNWKDNWVLSYNTNTNSWEPDKILDVFYSGHRDIYKITLDNGNIIKCTSNHKFLTRKNKWVSIDNNLTTNSIMLGRTSTIKIKSIEYIGKEDVYDITTEKNHNFALESGIVAHNSGKSTVARKAFVYQLYRVLCLRHPRAVYNIDPDSTIANFIISMTLKQVYDTNLMPFVKLMETMPCFQRVQSVRSFENFDLNNPLCPIPFQCEKSTGTIFFPDNIIIGCGSGISHTIGYNIVNSFLDEINEKGVDEALKLLNSIDNRFSSRFQGSDLVFQSIVSSARTKNSPVGEYIRRLPKNDKSIKIISPMLWEVKPDPNFVGDGTTFPVLVGNGAIPSKIITNPGELQAIRDNKYEEPLGCSLIHVPTVYKSKFELQLDQSIQDIAGMTTTDNSLIFRDISKLEDEKLTPEFYLEANIHENNDLLANLEEYDLFECDLAGKYHFKRAPNALRYCHIDLANGGDNMCDAGICILHKEYIKNKISQEKEIIYVIDLQLFINAKNKIDYEAIKRLLLELCMDKNIVIDTISADQFQSTMMLQAFEASGCFKNVKKVSVDVKLEPYLNTAMLIEKGLIKIGKCPKLKKELEALILNKGKVTRTTELKDGCDALVGAIWNAQFNYNDIPEYEYNSELNSNLNSAVFNDFIDENYQYLVDI